MPVSWEIGKVLLDASIRSRGELHSTPFGLVKNAAILNVDDLHMERSVGLKKLPHVVSLGKDAIAVAVVPLIGTGVRS